LKQAVRQLLQRIFGPVLARIDGLDARLAQLEQHARNVADDNARLAANQERLSELSEANLSRAGTAEELIGRSLMEQRVRLDAIDDQLAAARRALELRELPAEDLTMDMLDQRGAWFLNRAIGWRGFASRAGVYVNDPINFGYDAGSVEVIDVNERIVELPFVFNAVLRTPAPAAVLDVGSSESPVALSLATLGYQVTAVDPRGYAFPHPNITVRSVGAQDLGDAGPFDVAVLLSTIEHVGIGHYGPGQEPDDDIAVLAKVHEVVRPGGRLVLTTPFGKAAQDDVQRIYDPERLSRLLDGWEIESVVVVERRSATEWHVVGSEIIVPDADAFRVIMVTALRSPA
jgi:SAM-dependent methyltransferase